MVVRLKRKQADFREMWLVESVTFRCWNVLETYLNSDVETWNIEGLEHDLCCVLSVFWCVEWRLCLQRETEKR